MKNKLKFGDKQPVSWTFGCSVYHKKALKKKQRSAVSFEGKAPFWLLKQAVWAVLTYLQLLFLMPPMGSSSP